MARLDQKTLRKTINKAFGGDKKKALHVREKFGLKKSYQSREGKYVKNVGKHGTEKTVVVGGSGSSKSLKKLIRSAKGLSYKDRKRLRSAFKAGKTDENIPLELDDNKLASTPKEEPTSQNRAGLTSKKSEEQRIREQATSLKEELGGDKGFTSDGPPISRNDLYN